jgi:NAD(P)-dependent dehydrogenase (short-subunit alcohol dehydrogenase family)
MGQGKFGDMDDTTTTGTSATSDTLGLLADKVAFITGAGRGIGAAAARLFAREGARVLLAARTEEELKVVTNEVRAAGGVADYVLVDLADAISVRAAVDRVVEVYGRLDVAFNNGATIVPPGPMDQVPEADFDHVYAVNLKGAWLAIAAEAAAWLLSDRSSYVTGGPARHRRCARLSHTHPLLIVRSACERPALPGGASAGVVTAGRVDGHAGIHERHEGQGRRP